MLRCHSSIQLSLKNKNTNDRLLKHDLLFHDMFVNDDWKKDFKVEFENEVLSKEIYK